ncbi:MAG: sulfatase family protein [Bythopirellula sp.]
MNARVVLFLLLSCQLGLSRFDVARADDRPNILLAISDDQSFAHTSIAGCQAINTPNFDRIAREGVWFANGICGSPGCSPSRAALLTGRYTWQLEQAGTHGSDFPKKLVVYPDLLEQAGYFVGQTGKAWGPGNWEASGRSRNPAGPQYNDHAKTTPPASGIKRLDYAGNFADFLKARPAGRPFCFWYGGFEPHREFEKGSGMRLGKRLEDVDVPPFLPDTPEIRSDLLDYCVEIENFDTHLGRMLKQLEALGELDNTLIVVTSDNGMAFPRAKANCYEYGIHVPMAIRWPKHVVGGRVVEDLVGFPDLAPTFLEAAGVRPGQEMTGKSLINVLKSEQEGSVDAARKYAYSARERHSCSRWQNRTYPQRAIRSQQYLLIRNFRPQRWPAGAPQKFETVGQLGPPHGAYHDIDACPSLSYLVEHRDSPAVSQFFHLAVDKRPPWELFDIQSDPGCLENLIDDPKHASIQRELTEQLLGHLRSTGDPRVVDGGEVFESYKRYGRMRSFPPPLEER